MGALEEMIKGVHDNIWHKSSSEYLSGIVIRNWDMEAEPMVLSRRKPNKNVPTLVNFSNDSRACSHTALFYCGLKTSHCILQNVSLSRDSAQKTTSWHTLRLHAIHKVPFPKGWSRLMQAPSHTSILSVFLTAWVSFCHRDFAPVLFTPWNVLPSTCLISALQSTQDTVPST